MNKNLEKFEKAKATFLDGLNLFQKEDYILAEKKFLESLDLMPDRLSIIQNLIAVYIKINDKDKLREILKKYNHLSNEKEILYGIAYNHFFDGRYSESITLCEKLLKDKDLRYSIIDLLASNYKKNKLFLDALKIYKEKLREKKDYLIYYNIGCLFRDIGRTHKAIYYFNKSIKYKKVDIPNLWNLSLCHLRLGNLEKGFSLYEYRWLKKDDPPKKKFQELQSPINIDEIKNKNILISDEQGLGDTIQFSRFVIELLVYTKKITFVVNSKLKDLLKHLNKDIKIIDYENVKLDTFDYHLSLCSLPKFLNIRKLEDINYHLLNIGSQNKVELEKKNKFNVGICWSGNPNYAFDEYRSIPFKKIKNIFSTKDIDFYKLSQNTESQKSLEFSSIPNLINFGNKSIYELSQILHELDLVVSSDTSIIHLAGILNIKSILLLNYNSDWRWFTDKNKTIWYPSITIIKQEKFNTWEGVFERLEKKLKNLSTDK
mgnify:FL=1